MTEHYRPSRQFQLCFHQDRKYAMKYGPEEIPGLSDRHNLMRCVMAQAAARHEGEFGAGQPQGRATLDADKMDFAGPAKNRTEAK
jgi:hypothetical protein